jgi:hypothetical protein
METPKLVPFAANTNIARDDVRAARRAQPATLADDGENGAEGQMASPAGGPPERRSRQRRHALKSALIVFRGGHCTMGCRILNTSDAGALLMPADVILCPNEFVLKPLVGPPRACEVVWRKGAMLGVRYL